MSADRIHPQPTPAQWLALAVLLTLVAPAAWAEFTSSRTGITYQHGVAYLDELHYPPGFTHLRYHNPDAPKGGRLRVGEMGNWDSFVEVPLTGRAVAGVSTWVPYRNFLYDTLLAQAIDTPTDHYGRLADGVAVADDGAWIGFHLRDGARWHDGRPLTTADYVFTFDTYSQRANPGIRQPLAVFERLEVLNEREIRFHVRAADRDDPSLPIRIGTVPILPAHYWADRDITRTTLEPPLGSGPYRIGEFQLGRRIEWQRVDNYWGRNLPVNRGRFNFDLLVFDYFRDDQVLHEAVKGDLIDLREETVPVRWETSYNTPAVASGAMKKDIVRQLRPAGLWWPIFWNLAQPRFQDIRVREALWLLRDGAWLNHHSSYDYYDLATSFFHDSELASRGLPSEAELELLAPLRDQIPARVFTHEWRLVPHHGDGWHRDNLKRALALFAEAGWVIRNHALVHAETGEPFDVRLLAVSPALASSFIPYMQVLKKAGISATVKSPEISNWLHRNRSGDFDGSSLWFLPSNTPMLLITTRFSSASADQAYSPNWGKIRNPAVDALIEHAARAQNRTDFVAAIRALDRVLLWNFYYAPSSSRTSKGMVFWDRFNHVPHGRLTRDAFYDAWWFDAERAARVARLLAGGRN